MKKEYEHANWKLVDESDALHIQIDVNFWTNTHTHTHAVENKNTCEKSKNQREIPPYVEAIEQNLLCGCILIETWWKWSTLANGIVQLSDEWRMIDKSD